MVKEIKDKQSWEQELTAAGKTKTIIVDFSATWCGPCRVIGPIFDELAAKHSDIIALKIDVDTVESVALECNVNAMPTFQVWQDHERKEELIGASKDALKRMFEKYSKIEQGSQEPVAA